MKRSRINPISKKKQIEKGIEAELRAKLLEEHGQKCMECGRHNVGLSLHHIIFKSRGGKSEINNVEQLCQTCHSRKHGIRVVGDIQ
jgi:5-methylcytosine-specific restriction endonuclease McrA